MEKETVKVSREKLEELQRLASYSHGKLQKTYDWEGPTQRIGHISKELQLILDGRAEESEDFSIDYSW